MNRTVFNVPKMDCPSEERLIRMALERVEGIKELAFDLGARQLTIIHSSHPDTVFSALVPLNFGARISDTQVLADESIAVSLGEKDALETRVLKIVLVINALMFVAELIIGWIAQSAGLIADSLDMFADAAVYGLSLYAVGKAVQLKHRAARVSGYLQLLLALGAFFEVARRAFFGSDPDAISMMGVAFVALMANVTCLLLLARHRDGEAHMKASWIFTTNDVLANVGVILAGFLVQFTGSAIPDFVIGTVIASLVFVGAIRILKIARS